MNTDLLGDFRLYYYNGYGGLTKFGSGIKNGHLHKDIDSAMKKVEVMKQRGMANRQFVIVYYPEPNNTRILGKIVKIID